jgi:hypothetical protein
MCGNLINGRRTIVRRLMVRSCTRVLIAVRRRYAEKPEAGGKVETLVELARSIWRCKFPGNFVSSGAMAAIRGRELSEPDRYAGNQHEPKKNGNVGKHFGFAKGEPHVVNECGI